MFILNKYMIYKENIKQMILKTWG